MKIAKHSVVAIHYTLTDSEGIEIDSSAGKDPLVYLHGTNGLIPGLENALLGMGAGEKLQVTIQPEDGYGVVAEDRIQTVPRDAFGGIDDLKPGMTLEAQGPDGTVQLIIVREVNDDTVVVDGNHPLAGQVLNFDVSIESVREASEEEIEHGHAHHEQGHIH